MHRQLFARSFLVVVVGAGALVGPIIRPADADCGAVQPEVLTLELESGTLDGQPAEVPEWRRMGMVYPGMLSIGDERGFVRLLLTEVNP